MASSPTIVIRDIRFSGFCGVTDEERARRQWIAVDLELDTPTHRALTTDNLADTIDYAHIALRVQEIGMGRSFHLLEALAHEISETLLAEFPISSLTIFVKKLAPPIPNVHDSVGIRLCRTAQTTSWTAGTQPEAPAPFLVEQQHRLQKGLVLDLAAGFGRHTMYLAQQGFSVLAIDRDSQALAAIEEAAHTRHWTHVRVQRQDLECHPTVDSHYLGTEVFDDILVFFYLFRPLFPALITALKPGGTLIYETFLIDNHERRQHPRRKEFCLQHNELLTLVHGLRVLHYDEGEHDTGGDHQSAYTARLVAQKPVPWSPLSDG